MASFYDNKILLHYMPTVIWIGQVMLMIARPLVLILCFLVPTPNPIYRSSKKQGFVARSSNESEYHAIAYKAAELQWIRSLLDELGVAIEPSTASSIVITLVPPISVQILSFILA